MKIFTTILILFTMFSTTKFVVIAQTETKQSIEQQQEQKDEVKNDTQEKSEELVQQNTVVNKDQEFSFGTLLWAFLIPVFILIVFYLMFKVIKF